MPSLDFSSPLQSAVAQMAARTLAASPRTSREWEMLPAEIRMRSMFSARVEHERTLAEMQIRITAGLSGERPGGATMDKGRFLAEMRDVLRESGYKRPEGVRSGSLRDLKSRRRLELIWNMNVSQARGYAAWLSDMTPEALENEPCYELDRIQARREPRDWFGRWLNAGGKLYDGRMIAHKIDPIWLEISRFGTPWPPFDWGSGMGLRGVDIDEAEALGAAGPDDDPQVPPVIPFNSGFSMGAGAIPQSGRETLRSAFGDSIKFDGDHILLQRNLSSETDDQRKLDIAESLRRRARAHYRSAGEEMGSRGEGESEIAAVCLAQACAVAVGRKTLCHDTMTPAQAAAIMRATGGFPKTVVRIYENGHFVAWRSDISDLTKERVMADLAAHRGGMALGYGMESPAAAGEPHVLVRIYALPRRIGDLPLAGFHAPTESWRIHAEARAKDLADAMSVEMAVEWEVRP